MTQRTQRAQNFVTGKQHTSATTSYWILTPISELFFYVYFHVEYLFWD